MMQEAHYSTNFRMVKNGEAFQMTVREDTPEEFVNNIKDLIGRLQAEGWQFMGGIVNAQRPDERTTTAPADNRIAGVGQAESTAPGAVKREQIEGYVVGTYMSKHTQQVEPCLYLFTPRRPFRAYTVYPEKFSSLSIKIPDADLRSPWNGSAPSKEDAIKRGMYRVHPFEVEVTPIIGADGNVVMKNGYVQYGLHWSQAPVVDTAPPDDVQFQPPAKVEKIVRTWPHRPPMRDDIPAETALHWSMAESTDMPDEWGAGMPDEGKTFLADYRDTFVAYVDGAGTKMSDTQWQLLDGWATAVLNSDDSIEYMSGEFVKPVGFLIGMVSDNYALKPAEVPAELAINLCRKLLTTKAGAPNPDYEPNFEWAMSECLRCEANRTKGGF